MKPFVDAFHQGKRIVPRTLSELEFYLNGAALIFNVEAATGTIDEEVRINTDDSKLTFYHCLVKLNPSVYMELTSTMSKTPAKYPMIRTEMRQFPWTTELPLKRPTTLSMETHPRESFQES